MEITLRREKPQDYREVEILTYQAFTTMERPAGTRIDEHLLARKLRRAPGFVQELDYVALDGGKLVGNILYSRAQVRPAGQQEGGTYLLTFGPLSVLPAYQKQGVGGALVRHTLGEARKLGYKGVVIFGHPAYYPRFGFRDAAEYGITTAEGENFDAFMVLELSPGALADVSGRVHLDPVYFQLAAGEVAALNRELGL